VCHLEAVLGFRQAYISQQLAVLREGGIIQDRREGWNVFYRVSDDRIFEILAAAKRLLPDDRWERRLLYRLIARAPNAVRVIGHNSSSTLFFVDLYSNF
jgi:DNA-binding transcriptional ArsR family regulator